MGTGWDPELTIPGGAQRVSVRSRAGGWVPHRLQREGGRQGWERLWAGL